MQGSDNQRRCGLSLQSVIRLVRHLTLPPWYVTRVLPLSLRRRLKTLISVSEAQHLAELRLVAEADLPLASLFQQQSSRQRALELFAQLGVWDTEHNSGVLIYLQLLDRRVEIVADRGIHARVGQPFWDAVCLRMEAAFQRGDFESGLQQALAEISSALVAHFPVQNTLAKAACSHNENELSDEILVL
ncbi:MAG: TPM domain-containing protein [Pseudomonadota bacterium]